MTFQEERQDMISMSTSSLNKDDTEFDLELSIPVDTVK